jgi:DNA repair exonuclease SbcCD ATPase subunit
MEPKLETRQEKLKELQAQQEKLKKLQAELDRLNLKVEKNEKLTPDETKFFGELGWLSALAVTIASIAASL